MRGIRSRSIGLLGLFTFILLWFGSDLPAQAPADVLVRGTVVDDRTAEPIGGAQIGVENLTMGTQSDDQGAFSLRVPDASVVLLVRRIGYAPARVPLNGRTTVTIALTRQAVALGEVVTIGYGTQERRDVTGSVTSVSPQALEDKPNTNLVQALEGSIPGVAVTTNNAGAEPSLGVQIRGRRSILASSAPLVVVDGIPYAGSLSEINQADIAAISILKDASAAAIYGSRAANGVVIVTTKKGTVGEPRVSYSGYAGTQRVANLPRLMNAEEFAAFKCVRIGTAPGADCSTTLTATEQANLAAGVDTDWIGVATQTGTQQQHDLSISGGSEDTKYYLGGSILNVEGIARNDEFDRITARLNLDQRVKSWLSIGTNTQASRTERAGVPASFEAAFFANPLISPYTADGGTIAPLPWAEDPNTVNPLQGLLAIDDDVNKRLFTSNYLQLTVPRIQGLTYRLNAGLDLAHRNSGTYYGRNTYRGLSVGGEADVDNTVRNDWTLENILRYEREFGRHELDITTLYSQESRSLETTSFDGEGYPNDVLNYRSNVPITLQITPFSEERGLESRMARVNYGFDSRYLATFTVRRDCASVFGANNKCGTFPSVALGWNISSEPFFPFRQQVDALKLRLSYGSLGQDAIEPYETLQRLDDRSYVDGSNTPLPGYIPTTLGTPDLSWETTKTLNGGFDLSLFGERIIATVDAYTARTHDLLLNRSISSVHGITSIVQNIGKTANRGIELQLSTLNLDRGGWEWRSELNYSANRNKIVDLYGNGLDDIGNEWFIGEPIDVNYGYRFAGIWQVEDSVSGAIASSAQPTAKPGDVKIFDTNGDGVVNPEDRTIIGRRNPKYTAGFTNTLKYRGASLSATLYSVQGVTRSNIFLGTNQVFSDVRRNNVFRQYWTRENPINSYPANSNTSNPLSVPFYEDASFIRLRDVTLSYDVPESLRSRLGSERLRVYVNGRNLWTKHDWSGLDPELDEQRAIPLEKVVIFGINTGF